MINKTHKLLLLIASCMFIGLAAHAQTQQPPMMLGRGAPPPTHRDAGLGVWFAQSGRNSAASLPRKGGRGRFAKRRPAGSRG